MAEAVHEGHRERLKKQYTEHGLEPFQDHQVLEMLLFYAIPRCDTNPIAHRLIERFGSLDGVFSASMEELTSVQGIGDRAAELIKLIPAVKKLYDGDMARPKPQLDSTGEAVEYFSRRLENEEDEVYLAACLDGANRLISCVELARGDAACGNGIVARQLAEVALTRKAAGMLLIHCVPEPFSIPAPESQSKMAELSRILRTMGVDLLDCIIIADGDGISMKEYRMF